MDADISPQPVTRRQTMLRILKRTILIISVIATSLSACMDASKIDLDTSGATGLLLGGLTFEVLAGGGSAGCQPFGSSMIGCKGSISFASRASLTARRECMFVQQPNTLPVVEARFPTPISG